MNSSTNLINYTTSELNNNDMDNNNTNTNYNNNVSIDVVDYIKTDVYLSSTDKNNNSKNVNTKTSISKQQQPSPNTTIITTTSINNFIQNNNNNNNNVKDVEHTANGKISDNQKESINKTLSTSKVSTQTQSTQIPSSPLPNIASPPPTSQSYIRKSFSTIEKKLPIFYFRKKSDPTCNETEAIKERPKFIKSSSIARLLGNTYSTKKANSLMQKMTNQQNGCNANDDGRNNLSKSKINGSITSSSSSSSNTSASSSIPKIERFQKCSYENQYDSQCSNSSSNSQQQLNRMSSEECNNNIINNNNNNNKHKVNNSNIHISGDGLSVRTIRTISRGLGKFLWKKSQSIEISPPDPEYKVSYLGNVLTGWAKGDNCFEKPLATLWRNYTQNNKPDVIMRIKVCPSGLKATTRQHGLTEYWSHRITHCNAPKSYPRIFCWIYRHEGRKLKHELRCHAVLCSKETIAIDISKTLRENLSRALREFKRDKISRQNARLSLVNSVYENPSMPRRKILLSIGGNNYRPPLERSKSAPKLMSIEEAIGEDDENSNSENDDETRLNTKHNKHLNEKPSCCAIDPIYPSMTLGRRRCRRGHSIRRTGTNNRSFLRASTTIESTSTIPTTTTTTINTNTTILPTTPATPVPTLSLTLKSPVPLQTAVDSNHKRSVSFTEDLSSMQNSNQNTLTTNCIENDTQISNDPIPVTSDHRSTINQHCDVYDDDFDSLLLCNNYDTDSPLSVELMSYFDKKFNVKIMGSLNDLHIYDNTNVIVDCDKVRNGSSEYQSLPQMIMSNNKQSGKCKLLTSLSLDNLDNYESDIEIDDLQHHHHHHDHDHHDLLLDDDDVFFTQDKILKSIKSLSMNNHNNSNNNIDDSKFNKQMNNENNRSIINFDNDLKSDLLNEILANVNHLENDNEHNNHNTNNNHNLPTPLSILPLDSDEGSISSGCETASTVTTNLDESQLNSMKHQNDEQIDSIDDQRHSMNLMDDITNTLLIASNLINPPINHLNVNGDIKTTTLITNLKPSSYNNKYKYFNRTTTTSTSSTTAPNDETKKDDELLGEGIHNKNITNNNLINNNLDNIKIETLVNNCDDTNTSINNNTTTPITTTNNDSESELSDESGYVEYNRRKNNNSFKIENIKC